MGGNCFFRGVSVDVWGIIVFERSVEDDALRYLCLKYKYITSLSNQKWNYYFIIFPSGYLCQNSRRSAGSLICRFVRSLSMYTGLRVKRTWSKSCASFGLGVDSSYSWFSQFWKLRIVIHTVSHTYMHFFVQGSSLLACRVVSLGMHSESILKMISGNHKM